MPPIHLIQSTLPAVFRLAAIASAASLCLPLMAQEQQLERVEVTGSRIKRIDSETASAVQVIGRDEIERVGATTVTDVLRKLPAANSGGYNVDGVPSQSFGGAGISLRGLGAGSTLVLINGRRVAPFGFGSASFVDTNAIPADAIERVETLLDGASAIYGADAIAGVINIILRKNYQGLGANASFGITSEGDAKAKGVGINWGFGNLSKDGYNLFVNAAHHENDALPSNARARTADADFRRLNLTDRRSSFYRNVYEAQGYYGGAFIGPLAGCTPVNDPSSALNGRCANDNTTRVDLQPAYKHDSFYTAGAAKLPGDFEAFADASVIRTEYTIRGYSYDTNSYGAYTYDLLDVNGAFGNAAGAKIAYLVLPANHPQNPTASGTNARPVAVRYLFNDVANTTRSVSLNQRFTGGVRGVLAGWDVEGALSFSRSESTNTFKGWLQDAVLTGEVMDANGMIKPTFRLGDASANDPALMARLYPTLVNEALTTTSTADMRASRELWKLPGGALAVAVGAELRRERFTSAPDERFSSGAIQLFTITGSTGSRRIGALYGEVVAPVWKGVELSLAARTDRYSDFGSATTPKAGLKWKVNPQLAMRTTYAEGFRAPTLPEMNTGRTAGYLRVRDPKLCPVFDADGEHCNRYVPYESGQNPDLKAEKSKSITLGLVVEPVSNLSIAVDAYDIKRRDEVSTISTKYLLDHEADYPQFVIRNPQTGVIDKLFLLSSNLAATRVRGIDFDVRAGFKLGEHGDLALTATYNRLRSYKAVDVPGNDPVQYAGYYTTPKERWKAGAAWTIGAWRTSIDWNYTGPYQLRSSPSSECAYQAKNPGYCTVSSWLTADVYVGYSGFRNWQLGLSVQNVDNREAPLDADYVAYLTGYNSAFHNQLGRNYRLTAKYTFK